VSRELSIPTTIHGRVLVEDAAVASSGRSRPLIVAFHGYGQNAEDLLGDVLAIPGTSAWRVASVQALHRFYTRDHQRVIASWMTRQNRSEAIADNVEYVDRVIDRLGGGDPLVCLGFSQGAAMAYRAAIAGRHPAAGILVLAGDIPPELKADRRDIWPPVLIGVGSRDTWYSPEKVEADVAFLEARGVPHQVVRFEGGHEWTAEFKDAAAAWLATRR
jgi:predicted esterase